MFNAGSNTGVTSTGNWWTLDCNHALRVLDTSSQPALSIDWGDMRNTVGGALQCQSTPRFDSTVVMTGKTTIAKDNGAYRFAHYSGIGTSGGTGNYVFLLNGRQLITSGNQLDVFSDARMKQDVKTMEGGKALDVVKNLRSVAFRYKSHPEQQRYGFIAQECIKHPSAQDAVSVQKNSEDENYVFCESQMIPIMWAALRELTQQVQELQKEILKRDAK